ncbi:hypothetical protein P691DRAFT_755650 [Macrolepiota fuliginosa MF-IS2]|uniref:Zn(2)-C6 fungal-type domain-containing protein n=1 Tax=Macrolepiota fuliginosa MF-IS2 TaxID=1400762 RepID=A0A9P6C9R6_9AGAR|nr:hypothetical protein P691DRAFT_755650 [Macrolepiota fuliginosa MF-IS2]
MKEKRSAGHSARGPGSYVPQACSVCRHKKIKCDGGKPSCDTCVNNGRESECTYGKEPGRRPRTEALFQTMRKRIEVLGQYIWHLESMLDQCQREHAGSTAYAYQQYRPADWEESPESPDEPVNEVLEEEEEKDGQDTDVANELCLPAQNLRLNEGGLLLHGATAPFRYISEPERLPPPVPRLWTISENPDECYILLVGGADESHFNPNFDWSRYLPPEVHLDRREHDKILDLVFKFFTSWCLRIVPPLFLRDMFRALSVPKNQPPSRQPHYSAMLHNAILALGTAFSDDPTIRDLKARMYFLDKAKSYWEDECSRPHLCVVQALSLIGSFHSSQGEQTLGYVFFGTSARVGHALGLSVDCSSWVESGYITAEDQADRNWAYWTTYCQDVCWSLYVGREYCIPTASKSIPIPFADADFDKMDWVYPPAGTQAQPGYESKTFSSSCQLLMITKSIMDVVNTLDDPGNRQMVLDPKISEIDLALHQWHSNLPEELKNTVKMRSNPTPHFLQLHLTFHWSFILLHRPFYKRRTRAVVARENMIDHAKICKRAADSMMELLDVWRKNFTLRYAPITLVQTVFSAGTIYLLSALQAVDGIRIAMKELRHAMKHSLLCIDYLKEVGGSWPCATKISNILRDWLQTRVRPAVAKRTAISPFSSGILPPKEPERQRAQAQGQVQVTEGRGTVAPVKRRTSKKRQRSPDMTKNMQGRETRQRSESQNSLPPHPAPSISISSSSNTTQHSPSIPQMPSPPSSQPSPQPPQPQSSFQTETHSPQPQPLQSQGHSPLAVVGSLPPAHPSSQHLQVTQTFVHVSPRPQPWTALPDASQADASMSDGTRLERPAAPGPQSQSQSSQSQSQPSSQPRMTQPSISTGPSMSAAIATATSTNLFAADNMSNGISNSPAFQPHQQPIFAPSHFWAPAAIPPLAVTGFPSFTAGPNTGSNSAGDGSGLHTQSNGIGNVRPMSPVSYQLAMPNGQQLWETPFMPLAAFNGDSEEDGSAGMTALNELGFEFVNHRQYFGEGGDGMDMDAMGEMSSDWRGREGWEDIAGEVVREEEFHNWFGGISEN